MAAIPGPKLYNGMICGFAEAFSSLFSAFLMKWMTDIHASLLLTAICFVFNILYRLLGAGDGGLISMIALWFSILGVGGLVNTNYILIEMRIPPENLGATLVIMLTLCIFLSGCAPNLAYLPQPIPLYIQLFLLSLIFIALLKLPVGG